MKGHAPEIFDGQRKNAAKFMREFGLWKICNVWNEAMINPFQRIALVLSYMKGPKVDDLGFRGGEQSSEARFASTKACVRGEWCRGRRNGVDWWGNGDPSPPSFDLICLIRTPIETELKPSPLAGLARGFLLPVASDGGLMIRGASSALAHMSSVLLTPRALGFRV